MEKKLYWIPRFLAIAYILFIGLFSLDVFGEKTTLLEMIAAFLIHNIPSFIFIVFLGIAWKKEAVGGALFIAGSLFWMVFLKGDIFWKIANPIILFPAIIGFLFLTDFFKNKK